MTIRNILILMQVKGIGPAFFKKNRAKLLHTNDIITFIRDNLSESSLSLQQLGEKADEIINRCQLLGIQIVSYLSDDYPPMLLEINDPPPIIYLKGNTSLLHKAIIAIIGTRKSTFLGNSIASRVGEYFADEYAICNGLVEGIDEHSVFCEGVARKNTIGILSGGLNFEFTCSNKLSQKAQSVLSTGGLIISEFPPDKKEDQYSAAKSSRLQAGLSQGIILIQSKIDGGSKYALTTFSQLPRTLGIIHYPSASEYQEDDFEANRLIVQEQRKGIADITKKKIERIQLNSIITITNKSDYELFKVSMVNSNNKDQTSRLLF